MTTDIDSGRIINNLQEKLHKQNLELDALYFVWCDGGCKTGIRRYKENNELPPLTEELVEQAEAQVKRMRSWINNYLQRGETHEIHSWDYRMSGLRSTSGNII